MLVFFSMNYVNEGLLLFFFLLLLNKMIEIIRQISIIIRNKALKILILLYYIYLSMSFNREFYFVIHEFKYEILKFLTKTV